MSSYGPRPNDLSTCAYFSRDVLRKPWGFNKRNVRLDPWGSNRRSPQLTDYSPTMDLVKNKDGCIRWFNIRAAYFSHLVDLPFCVDAMKEWRDTREDLWIDRHSLITNEYLDTWAVVASKRGNEWYKRRLNKKFSFFEDLPPIHFFCEDWGRKTTPMLFITLTVDPELVNHDIDQAWDVIPHELHLFDTKLRQAFGRFVKLRVWEAHGGDGKSRGFPHCHTVYYFLDRQFEVWEHFSEKKNKKGFLDTKRTWRVANKHLEKIRSLWGLCSSEPARRLFGVDVQGVSDTLGALSEVRKYITKTIWSDANDLTTTLCCLHNKQIYRFSQNNPFPFIKEFDGCSPEYILDRLRELASKDFIGAIWGPQAYYDFYKRLYRGGHTEGLAEPGLSALVNTVLQDCNNAESEPSYFKFCGMYLHSDLVRYWPEIGDREVFNAKAPDDVRLLLGVDHESVSWISGSVSRFSVDLDGVSSDRDDVEVD